MFYESDRVKRAVMEGVRAVLGPLARQRFLIERARYRDRKILSSQAGNDYLAQTLAAGQPFAAGKLGASELGGLLCYEKHKDATGQCSRWGGHAMMLHRNAGVYPPTPEVFSRFCRVYIDALRDIDSLAVWFHFGEHRIQSRYAAPAQLLSLTALEPYYHARPWSRMLAGKRVLVLTPFADTVQAQGRRLRDIWRAKPEVMTDIEVDALRVPLSAALVKPEYVDWFIALDAMRREMESRQFDVAIVGAGAWSLPLVAHAKRMGKWAIHLGGSTQILFGIKGRRWDNNPVVVQAGNEAWVRPNEGERPREFTAVERGCYW